MSKDNELADRVFVFAVEGKRMFTGYGDGLIVFWDLASISGAGTPTNIPFVGHTNKINHIEIHEQHERIYSCSDDCTLR